MLRLTDPDDGRCCLQETQCNDYKNDSLQCAYIVEAITRELKPVA